MASWLSTTINEYPSPFSLARQTKQTHAGPGGCDEVNEIKLWTPLLKTSSTGVGNASSGGTPASVGHSYAFGNTEEKVNMGLQGARAARPRLAMTMIFCFVCV